MREEESRHLKREVRFQEEEELEEDGTPSSRMTKVEKSTTLN